MSLLEHKPCFGQEEAVHWVWELYGIRGKATPMPSERDQNFLLKAETGKRFVLKIANALEDRDLLEAQNQAMSHLTESGSVCPQVVPTQRGESIAEILSPSGTKHMVRLVSYLPGIPFGQVRRHSTELLHNLGRYVGRMDRALTTFDHPAMHRDFHWDLARAVEVIRGYQSVIADTELRHLVDRLAAAFEHHVAPVLPRLRTGVIHNDANDYNVIVGGGDDPYTRNQHVIGIIDFGDMVYSYTVSDLAIAIAYAILDKPDPLAAAAPIVRGYHVENPLTEDEISTLFGLTCMRLCLSVSIAAYQHRERPHDPYLAISQEPIRETLPRLAQIHPRFAEAAFRHESGFVPVPRTEAVCSWLRHRTDRFSPVLGVDLSAAGCVVFDLSVGSPLVSGDQAANAEPELSRRLFGEMKQRGVEVGIGRHDEARLLCTSPLFVTGQGLTEEQRTIHLGVDLFAEAGTPVYAPIAGALFAFSKNEAPEHYGPVVVLQHSTDDGDTFHTLYGHLSKRSLEGFHLGKSFDQGEQIGTIGTPAVNGGWTPHLHFQIITDLLELGCNFPRVCRASQRHIWTRFSPDPNVVLGVPVHRFPPREPKSSETLATRRKRLGPSLSIEYRNPVKIERGWMQYLYDETGRRYLDGYNNVPHVGHCHPRVVQAGQKQMGVLNTNTRYLHDFLNRYADRLCATMPDRLSICFFLNSATEANELALRLARTHTQQRDMIVLEGAYHGHTTTLIDISPYKHDGPGGTGAPSWVHTAPIADVYRGPYKKNDPQAGRKYAEHVLQIIQNLRRDGTRLAGFIAETCPSVGGQIIFPENYLTHVYRYVHEAGGLCIADEVQTAYGRIGTHFYAFEAEGVVPDIVVLGKPIGNGHPIGAVVTTPEIAASFDTGMEFFSTFGGNTVSCAIGMAVLEVVLQEKLQAHALRVGNHLLLRLNTLKDRYAIVGDVRGSGLFIGVELVRNRTTLEPAGDETSFVANRLREHGILVGTEGPYDNVIKIRPPMPFSEGDADFLVATMDTILAEDFGNHLS
jgi:4-aminobutyrate aminotransferase-like enzyme/Ser/Thr protein kinase RdoA (MazF antagonist)